jgi:hypothetical protein
VEEVKKFFVACGAVILSVTATFACWQTEQSPVMVRTVSLNGRVTFDDDWGGPRQSKMTFTLHKELRSIARRLANEVLTKNQL